MQSFVEVAVCDQDNTGKQYDLSIGKFFKLESKIASTKEDQANGQKYDSFFCSELVAALFKACGLLSAKVSCTQYWPVTFSDKESIDFLNGGKLEAEMVVNLDL